MDKNIKEPQVNFMDKFEEFFQDCPASVTSIILALIFICVTIAGGLQAAMVAMSFMLCVALVIYWVKRSS